MKMCKLDKEEYKKRLESMDKKKYKCEKCGRKSEKKKDLCKPVKHKKD
jgi:transposase-like protein